MDNPERKIQLGDFIKITAQLFKVLGLNFFHPEEKKSLMEKFKLVMWLSNMILDFSGIVLVFFYYTFSGTNEITEFACYGGFVINSLTKIIIVWKGRLIIRNILVGMDKIFPRTRKEITEYHLNAYYKRLNRNMRILLKYHFFVTSLFNMLPAVQSVFELLFYGGDFQYRFPFILHYVFNEKKMTLYPFLYVYQTMSSYYLSCCYVGSDFLLIALVHLVCMHLNYLAARITNFVPKGTDDDINELKEFIQRHGIVLSLSEKINRVFSLFILINYGASCGLFCLIAIQVTMGTEIIELMKFFAFLISSWVHISFICYFGTNLLQTSLDLSNAVFSHQWYLGNLKYKKMIILIIARADKPVYLTAYKFFVVSMESYKSLMTTSYQFFTLIKARYEGN